MKEIFSWITLRDEFVFEGSLEALNEKLRFQNNKKFRVEWTNAHQFKFLAKFSFGTMAVFGFPNIVDGIKGYASLAEKTESKVEVKLKTKVRIELIVSGVLFLLLTLFGYIKKEVFLLNNHYIFLVALIWFWFVYRVQEQLLFNKLKKYLQTQKLPS